MARPKEFDEGTALSAAVDRFWEYGYEATSVRDLAEAMGIVGASLYNAFGDKRSLFRRSVDHYVEHSFAERSKRFEAYPSPLLSIIAFFQEIIDLSLRDTRRKGCLLVNSALEVAPHDPEFQQVVADILVQAESFFLQRVEAGQAAGEITTAQPAEDLARHLLGVLLGIRVLARVRPERKLLEGLARPAFALLRA